MPSHLLEVGVEETLSPTSVWSLSNSYGSQAPLGGNLTHGTVGLVDGNVGVSVAVGIRIGDLDSAKRFSPDHTRTFRIWSVVLNYLTGAASKGRTSRATLSAISSSATSRS
jgi:hypothetical protein